MRAAVLNRSSCPSHTHRVHGGHRGPVPLQNFVSPGWPCDLVGRCGSGMIGDRVSPTPLSDHGVPVSGGWRSSRARLGNHCRAADIAARGRGVAPAGQPTTALMAGSGCIVRVGPAAAATAEDAPAGHACHAAGLAPSSGDAPVALPESARSPVADQADSRINLPARTRESTVAVSAGKRRTRPSGLPARESTVRRILRAHGLGV
jgi:hypothetical protein